MWNRLLNLSCIWPHRFLLADIEVACYGYEGIDAVKDALRAGLNCSTEAMPIKVTIPPFSLFYHLVECTPTLQLNLQINLIAPPRYVMTTTTLERTEGLSVLNQAMAAIKEKIEEKRGVFNIQMEVMKHTFLCIYILFRNNNVEQQMWTLVWT